MTLVHLESFDNFEDDLWLVARYDGFDPQTVGSVVSLHGGNALASSATSGTIATLILPTDDEYTIGFRTRMLSSVDTPTGNQGIEFRLVADGDQFTLRFVEISADSEEWRIEVRQGGMGGTVIATQVNAQHMNAWYYIEFQVLADSTVGTYEVRIDGVNIPELTDTGVDTTISGNPNIDRVDIHIHQNGVIDDIYILNNAGSANNDFLGPIHVQGLRPDVDGNQTDWTPSSGSDHFALVNEDGTGSLGTNNVNTLTVTDTDLFGYDNLSRIDGASVSIPGVELVSLMELTGAGSEDFHHVIRSGGMEHDASSQSVVTTSQEAFSDIFETNLAESTAWTVADINIVEFGAEYDG